MERLSADRSTENLYESDMEGERIVKLCTRWLGGVKKAFDVRSLEPKNAKVKYRNWDREVEGPYLQYKECLNV